MFGEVLVEFVGSVWDDVDVCGVEYIVDKDIEVYDVFVLVLIVI